MLFTRKIIRTISSIPYSYFRLHSISFRTPRSTRHSDGPRQDPINDLHVDLTTHVELSRFVYKSNDTLLSRRFNIMSNSWLHLEQSFHNLHVINHTLSHRFWLINVMRTDLGTGEQQVLNHVKTTSWRNRMSSMHFDSNQVRSWSVTTTKTVKGRNMTLNRLRQGSDYDVQKGSS